MGESYTYTYTARSATDPANVVTFTLQGENLLIDIGAPVEHMDRTLQAADEETEVEGKAAAWIKPMAVSLMERGVRPFHISDVAAQVKGKGLLVSAWVRAAGLRLAPVLFIMEQVDNPEAAEAFVDTLNTRKKGAPSRQRFPGPLDYWASWVVGSFLVLFMLGIWLWSRDRDTE